MILVWMAIAALTLALSSRAGVETSGKVGFAATPLVARRQASTPALYRVLVPWLMVASTQLHFRLRPGKVKAFWHYAAWKWALTTSALVVCNHLFGPGVALFLVLTWIFFFQYDYWDDPAEALCFLLALTCSLPLAILSAIIGGLTKETTILVAPIYGFASGDWLGALFIGLLTASILVAVRLYQGKPSGVDPNADYKRNALRNLNWLTWIRRWPKLQHYFVVRTGWTICSAAVVLFASSLPPVLEQTVWMPPIMCLLGLAFGLLWEPRMLGSNAIWIGAALIGAYK